MLICALLDIVQNSRATQSQIQLTKSKIYTKGQNIKEVEDAKEAESALNNRSNNKIKLDANKAKMRTKDER